MSWIIVAEIVLYCICMIGIGVYFSRKKLSQEEFMLGGNKLPGWALAFSERAACESVYLLMGKRRVGSLGADWIRYGYNGVLAVFWQEDPAGQ